MKLQNYVTVLLSILIGVAIGYFAHETCKQCETVEGLLNVDLEQITTTPIPQAQDELNNYDLNMGLNNPSGIILTRRDVRELFTVLSTADYDTLRLYFGAMGTDKYNRSIYVPVKGGKDIFLFSNRVNSLDISLCPPMCDKESPLSRCVRSPAGCNPITDENPDEEPSTENDSEATEEPVSPDSN